MLLAAVSCGTDGGSPGTDPGSEPGGGDPAAGDPAAGDRGESAERAGEPPGTAGGTEVLVEAGITEAGALPDARTEVAGARFGGGVAVVGGLTAEGEPTARADRYDPESDSWSRLPDLPVPLHHTAAVEFGGRLWVVGGYTGSGGDWVPVDRVASLGVGEDAWRDEPRLATPRGALGAAVVDGAVVAGGGVDAEGTVLASTEVLGADDDAWRPGPALRTAREHFAMATVGGDVYAIAGRAGGLHTNHRDVEVLRGGAAPGDRAWEEAGSLGRSRGGIGAAAVEGMPCVAGGEEPEGTIAPVECLVEGTWQAVGALGAPRHGLAVVALGARLHVVGGGPEPGLTVSGAHEVLAIRRR